MVIVSYVTKYSSQWAVLPNMSDAVSWVQMTDTIYNGPRDCVCYLESQSSRKNECWTYYDSEQAALEAAHFMPGNNESILRDKLAQFKSWACEGAVNTVLRSIIIGEEFRKKSGGRIPPEGLRIPLVPSHLTQEEAPKVYLRLEAAHPQDIFKHALTLLGLSIDDVATYSGNSELLLRAAMGAASEERRYAIQQLLKNGNIPASVSVEVGDHIYPIIKLLD